jgi:hypothetical protein
LAVPFGITALALFHHTAVALEFSLRHHVPFGAAICRWDCAHYAAIVEHGYQGIRWAFLPLFPLLTRAAVALSRLPAAWVGALLSTTCLLGFIVAVERLGRGTAARRFLVPQTGFGWFLVLYAPASYVLHSNHTEALFLLLSYVAFVAAARGRPGWAGVLAGLSVWTRNQGVFVAIACALLGAAEANGRSERARRFLLTGAVSLAFFAGLLLFEARAAGNPLAYLAVQQHWTHAHSAMEVLRTFWCGNPWQGHQLGVVLRHVAFGLLVVGAAVLVRLRWPLGLYACLSVMVLPLQAELLNTYRFGAVLFPVLFLAGDELARRPAWLRWTLVLAVVAINHSVTRAYVTANWAY